MAILKHIASKNADYGKSLEYLMFQHDELMQKPVLDDAGNMILREEYYLDGINCHPSTFEAECEELNDKWKKNRDYNEIKSHHYIISFDPQDAIDRGLTGERAQQLGMEYAKKNFPGHQALICTHMDGHNGSGRTESDGKRILGRRTWISLTNKCLPMASPHGIPNFRRKRLSPKFH